MLNLILCFLLILPSIAFADAKKSSYTTVTSTDSDDFFPLVKNDNGTYSDAKISQSDLASSLGISQNTNWEDIQGLKSSVNWEDEGAIIGSNAIIWRGLQQVQRADINWSNSDISVESATGNVGIGTIYNTSGTGERLTVSSPTIKIAKFISTQTSSSGTGTALVDIATDDGAAIAANDIIARIRFLGSTNTSHSLGVGADIAVLSNEDWTGSANGTSIQFNTASNGSAGAATRMTINQANVGINTAAPSARLEVSTTTAQDIFKVNDNGAGDTTPFVINSDGNIGIGSSNPQAKVTIIGNGTTTGSALNIRDSSFALKATVLDSGNVGIGSATPGALLDVQGAIRAFTATSPITKKTGANTACNTTCAGTMCVWAQNTADFSLVDCADATADACGCLGP